MSGILDLLNPIKDLADLANSIIGKFVTDPKDKAELAKQVAGSQAALETAALDASKATILAEEQGSSWLQRSWRPVVALGMFAIILYAGVAVSLFHFPQINMVGVPPELWTTFKLCIGGYMGLRTLDKGVDAYFKSKNGNGGSNGNGNGY